MKKTITLVALLWSAQAAFAGWGAGQWAGNYYINGDEEDKTIDAGAYDTFNVKAGNKSVYTVDTLTMKDLSTMIVAYNTGNEKNLTDLTVSKIKAKDCNLIIEKNQKLTLNGLEGTLESITVDGSLVLGKDVQGLNNFIFGSAGSVTGTYNLGQSYKGALNLTLTDPAAIEALASGKTYEKSLFGVIWNLDKATSITLTMGDYETSKVIYKHKDKYYDGWTPNENADMSKHQEIKELDQNTSYIVVSLRDNASGALGISALVTAIPEPTTATLSLLALAGLAVRRRRK